MEDDDKAYACDDEDGDEGEKVFKKGLWTSTEDAILVDYVQKNGEGNWNAAEKDSGLSRSGKSCRFRWKYHLRPDLKKGSFSEEEERRVVELQSEYGNKWSSIATKLPGRTDQDVKNFWRTKGFRIAGKPVYPSGIVLKHSTESREFDILDRHTSGSNHLGLLQEGNLEIPIPNLDVAQLQSHYSFPCPTSSLHEVPPLCLTRRNCRSDSYTSYPFVNNASVMNEIPPIDKHVYSTEVVAESLVEPSPQSLVGVSSDTSCFRQPLPEVVPGSPPVDQHVYSPEVVAEPLVEPSPQSLVGVSPDTSCFGQPLSDVPDSPPVHQHVYSPEVVAEPLVEPCPQSLVGVSPDTSRFGQPLSDVFAGSPDTSNYGEFDSSYIFSEAPNLGLSPLQYPDACLSSHGTPAADHPRCLNQLSPAHPCQPVHPSPAGSSGHLEDIAYQEKCFPSQITVFSTGVVPTKDVNQSSYSPLDGNASFKSNTLSIHESSAEENQPFDEDAFVAGFLKDNEEPDDTDNSKPEDDVLNSSSFR